jgi:steroid delta-isomerase-like uncharacterized protein
MTHGTTRDSEALVRRWFEELFNRGKLAVADEILAADVDYRGPPSLTPQAVSGPDDIKEYVQVYQNAFPDLQYTVDTVTAVGDRVLVEWTATGTHRSDLFGIESTGEVFTVDGIDVFTVEEGRITAVHAQWDTLGMVQELGAVPEVGLVAE